MTAPSARSQRSALRALRHPHFALFFAGNLLSNCGTWFQNIALALLVYRLTRSSLWVGVVNFAQFAGVLFLMPWAGAAADRFNRKRLLIITQVGATTASGALALLVALSHGSIPVILLLALALGVTTAFAMPAMQAILPALVPREELGSAIALNAVTFNLARAVGPIAGALVVARLGISWAIAINALSYLFFAAALLVIEPREGERRAASAKRPRLMDSMRMMRERDLVVLLWVVAAISIAMDPVNTLTPAFATQVFHHVDTFVGVLIGAFGCGAVLASVVPADNSPRPLVGIASMMLLLGAGMIVLSVSSVVALGLGALAVAGFGYLAGQTRATTLLQLEVSDRERGRAMAMWSFAFLGSRPLASLVDGGLAALVGVRFATVAMEIPVLAVAAMLFRRANRAAPATG